METDISEKYVSVNPEYELIRLPNLGILYKKRENKTNEMPSRLKDNLDSFWINRDALTILELCDGTKKLKDILTILSENEDENVSGKIREFLNTASKLDHVKFLSSPASKKWKARGSKEFYMPVHVTVELTDNCNLNCAHCYRRRGSRYIDAEELNIFFQKMTQETLISAELTGGEPTLHPDFLEITKACVENLVSVGILTNGTLLAEKTIEELSPYKDSLYFSISLDSHDPTYHDIFRGMKGAWEQTVSTIRRLVDEGFLVRVAMSISQENIYHLEPLVDFCARVGVSAFSFNPILPFGKAKGLKWNTENVRELVRIGETVAEKYRDIIPVMREDIIESQYSHSNNCGAGWKNVTIDPEGYVRPCAVSDAQYNIGKINLSDPVTFFKENREICNMYAHLLSPSDAICGNCSHLSFCKFCVLRAIVILEEGHENVNKCNWIAKNGINTIKKLRASSSSS
jgi:radical SAM protein with 4Fe4S-binding SPASM domain